MQFYAYWPTFIMVIEFSREYFHSEQNDGVFPFLLLPFHLLPFRLLSNFTSFLFHLHLERVKRIWYLSPMWAAKVQASLRIRAASPEPLAARSYKQWVKRNLQTESQIPGPSEWLGMRSWNLSWRHARRHKFAWRGSLVFCAILEYTACFLWN